MCASRLQWIALVGCCLLEFCHGSDVHSQTDGSCAEQIAARVEQLEAPQATNRSLREDRRIYRNRVTPNWVSDNTKFWYRNELPNGGREFIFVDAVTAKREKAFDHNAVANALASGGQDSVTDVDGLHLPLESLEYDADGKLVALLGGGKRYLWDAVNLKLTESASDVKSSSTNGNADRNNARTNSSRGGAQTGAESSITFDNRMAVAVEVFWLSGDGTKQSYGKVEAGRTKVQHTFGGHRWEIVGDKQESYGVVAADDTPNHIVIDGRKFEPPAPARRRSLSDRDERGSGGRSPDGKWLAAIENFNVVVKSTYSDQSITLSHDGREGFEYGQLTWSPDSQTLVTFRVEAAARKEVHLIRSSPKDGGRAQLESRPYALPGDPFPTHELNIFRVGSREQVKPIVDRFEHEWLRPRVRFSGDGKRFTYEQTDRGHQRFRLIEIDLASASARNLIDEKSDTFIWTAHTENQGYEKVNWLTESDEFVFATEKNGWRQLILIDSLTGQEKRALTPAKVVVRGVEMIDEANRRLWFSASGVYNDQDPYLVHHGYVDLDSGKLVWLTEGNGNHTIQFSPDRKYIVDTYSRIDAGPITELRQVSDGRFVCKLEQADLRELVESGWSAPEVFVAKGRDGQTDIWGIICWPRDFDASRKYPIIEDIYAGPHGSFVPKSFSPSSRYDSLTQLGFIVVKIDGMGTANRSKAFHDVCWRNLKDGGFEDRILWMKAAAAKFPQLDLARVGIYGTSAGGQNAGAAVLFHPEFYKVAVAACGCHDNRMDKASWNEQWMGYPVGPQYSECSNIDNAHRLQGKLLLIVGEMDTNVPPESTLRFADALIRANKDFDLLVVPNAGHGMGGAYGQRRMHDYFVRHLLAQEPPNRNADSNAQVGQ